MAQSDLRLAGDVEPRNETARLRGGPHVRQGRGRSRFGDLILPENLPSRQAGNAHFPQRRSFAGVSHRPLEPGLEPGRGTCAHRPTPARPRIAAPAPAILPAAVLALAGVRPLQPAASGPRQAPGCPGAGQEPGERPHLGCVRRKVLERAGAPRVALPDRPARLVRPPRSTIDGGPDPRRDHGPGGGRFPRADRPRARPALPADG
jgi:hypothetical protein